MLGILIFVGLGPCESSAGRNEVRTWTAVSFFGLIAADTEQLSVQIS